MDKNQLQPRLQEIVIDISSSLNQQKLSRKMNFQTSKRKISQNFSHLGACLDTKIINDRIQNKVQNPQLKYMNLKKRMEKSKIFKLRNNQIQDLKEANSFIIGGDFSLQDSNERKLSQSITLQDFKTFEEKNCYSTTKNTKERRTLFSKAQNLKEDSSLQHLKKELKRIEANMLQKTVEQQTDSKRLAMKPRIRGFLEPYSNKYLNPLILRSSPKLKTNSLKSLDSIIPEIRRHKKKKRSTRNFMKQEPRVPVLKSANLLI